MAMAFCVTHFCQHGRGCHQTIYEKAGNDHRGGTLPQHRVGHSGRDCGCGRTRNVTVCGCLEMVMSREGRGGGGLWKKMEREGGVRQRETIGVIV